MTISAATYVTPVHDQVPGRVRYKVAGLYRCESLRQELDALLKVQDQVEAARINTLTGTVLIRFHRERPPETLAQLLEEAARRFAAARPRPAQPQPDKPKAAAAKRQAKAKTLRTQPLQVQTAQAWHALPLQDLLPKLSADTAGLTEAEAARRLARYGANILEEAKRRSALAIFAGQLASPPVVLLGISAAVSVSTGGVADAVVILSVVLINAVIGYATESSAERTINALGQMTPEHVPVLRDGQRQTLSLDQVVPGDVLLLTPGTYIAADARLIAGNRLSVDESALTGESLPVNKSPDYVAADDTPLADRLNMVYRGTVVTGGSGLALVVATGHTTEIGVIQSLVGTVRPPETPLQRQLDDMGMQLALASGAICLGMFGIGLWRGYGWLQMLNSSISLAVAAVPEGLPAVATTTLALGIKDMLRHGVLIRQLPAVESLGSVQVICLDKTGTLTLNRMETVALDCGDLSVALEDGRFLAEGQPVRPLEHAELQRLLEVVCLCSETGVEGNGGEAQVNGSPTEKALIEVALMAGLDVPALRQTLPVRKTIHRAENRPYMVTIHARPEGGYFVAVKGSPSDVLTLCRWRQVNGKRRVLSEGAREALLTTNDRLAGRALRVLAMAYGNTDDPEQLPDLVWLGLAGMEDIVRPGMAELMAQFQAAGIRTAMITGDQSATAYSVGSRLGLSGDRPLEIIDSGGLDKLDPALLSGLVRNTAVFARVSPAHKLRIVQALQQAGCVVAMTGDGVNDGPALKAADVGVAMGDQGTDVARAVADVVLQDDNLHTMIVAIRQGRTIYANIRKSLHYLLSSNLSEIEIMLVGTILGRGEVLNPLQLLWINLMTDILPALALAMEPAEQDVLKQPPRDPAESIVRRSDGLRLAREATTLSAGALGVYGYSLARYGLGAQAGTNTFMTITLAQLLHALSCRSERTGIFSPNGREQNPHLHAALAASALVQVAAAFLPPLRGLLRMTPVGPADWLAIAAGAGLPFVANELGKLGKPP